MHALRPDRRGGQPHIGIHVDMFDVEVEEHARRHVDVDAGLLGLSRRNARERVAGFILELAERGDRVTLPVARGEMADLLGMTIETVSRQLARLRSDGVVELEKCGRDCAVLDRSRLAAIAGLG